MRSIGQVSRWRRFVVALLILLLIGGAGAGSLIAKSIESGSLEGENAVVRALAEVRLQDSLEWRAIGGEEVAPLRAAIRDAVRRAHEELAAAAALGLDEKAYARSAHLQNEYHTLVLAELDLLTAGLLKKAERLDEDQVDPAATVLLSQLRSNSRAMHERAGALRLWSDLALLAVIVSSLLLMGILHGRMRAVTIGREQELRAESRYRSLVDQAADLVLVCDARGQVSYLGPAAQRTLSSTLNERSVVGKGGSELEQATHPDDLPVLHEQLEAAQESGTAGPFDLRLMAGADADPLVFEVTARDLRADPAIGGFVLTAHDVTEIRRLTRAKDDFVSTVSHELRTPLTSIQGYVEMLESGDFGPCAPDQERAVGVIRRNAERLLHLIEELLLLSGAEAKGRGISAEVDLAEIVDRAVDAVQTLLSTRDLRIEVATGAHLTVIGDDIQLERVVSNLLTNAIKFTPDGGRVEVRATRSTDTVHLAVADSGVGVPPEEQLHIFDRFFRASTAIRNAVPGTGLGLAVCREIVEAHGGTIALTSDDGGTTVSLALPAHGPDGPRPLPDVESARVP